MLNNNNCKQLVFLIFLLALGLRLIGINHSFPFIFHPDEPAVILPALGIRFYLNPGHFDWPHLYIYFNYFIYMGFSALRNLVDMMGYKPMVSNFLPYVWDDTIIFYFITRILTALLAALTVVPVYMTGTRLFNTRVGLFAALGFALIPFHVRHSHYALIDIPATLFVACSMYFAAGILQNNKSRDYAGAGTYIGLAASTKYNGGLSAFSVPLAHFIRIITSGEKWFTLKGVGQLVLSGVMAALAFFIGTPFALLDYSTFSRTDGPNGAFWQFHNVGSVALADRVPKFFNDVAFKLSDDLGYTILVSFILVFVFITVRALFKKSHTTDKYLWFFVITGMFLLFYISGFARSRSQYFLIAYPYIAIVFGYFVDWLDTFFQERLKYIGFLLLALLFAIPAYMSFVHSYTFYNLDTRIVLYNWLKDNVKPDQRLFFKGNDVGKVLDKFSNVRIKVSSTPPHDDVLTGYYIQSAEEVSLLTPLQRLKMVKFIDNNNRLGTFIGIYTAD